MSTRPHTREHRPPTEEPEAAGSAILLSAFPRPVAVPLPTAAGPVGHDWLAGAGLADDEVSGQHLRFHRTRGQVEVEDVGSRNGTFVDGHRLRPGERLVLESGALLRVGRTLFVYRDAFTGSERPDAPLGRLVGPWGLRELRADVARLAGRPPRNTLILGESGTGKQLLAEEVARVLERGDRRLGEINLAGIPEDRLEADLFGWEQGAFTGGVRHLGAIRNCRGGAIFLDEIGEVPLALQSKLLRLLQDHEVQPLGALRPEVVDVLILAATNRDLDDQVKGGQFRLDLLARFPVRLHLPRLADRPEDLYAILEALHRPVHGALDPARVRVEAVEMLMLRDWPANVRDLERLAFAIDPTVELKPSVVRQVLGLAAAAKAPPLTEESIAAALAAHGGNQTRAARHLEVSRPRLLRAMKKVKLKGGGVG